MATIDIFNPLRMTKKGLKQIEVPTPWLVEKFFTKVEKHDTNVFQFENINGNRAVARYERPEGTSKKVDKKGYNAKLIEIPYTKEHKVTTAENVLNDKGYMRDAYDPKDTPVARAAEIQREDLADLKDRQVRLREVQAAEALTFGKVTVKGDGYDAIVNFNLKSSHNITLTGDNRWNQISTSDPIQDLVNGELKVKDDSTKLIGDVILGKEAADWIIKNDEVRELMDIRRIKMGEIDPKKLNEKGVRYIGTLSRPGIDLWEYVGSYDDPISGKNTRFIDPKKAIAIGAGCDFRQHYGGIRDLAAIEQGLPTFREKMWARSWRENNPSVRMLEVQSAPLMATHQVDGIYVIKVL